MERVIVIGGGQSVKQMDVKEICKRGYAIGVNDAAVRAPVNMGLSMDRRWADWRLEDIKNKPFWLRKLSIPAKWEGLNFFKSNHETDTFSKETGTLNGRNSGHCAVNLAYQMKPKQIFLFGFDMKGGYWYPQYPWTVPKRTESRILQNWVTGFIEAKRMCDEAGIELFLVGESQITNVPKLSYGEFLECTK